jgi:hypothetical protein
MESAKTHYNLSNVAKGTSQIQRQANDVILEGEKQRERKFHIIQMKNPKVPSPYTPVQSPH